MGDLYLLPFNVIDDDRLLMLVELPTLQELSIAFSYPFFTGGADKSLARPGWKQATATEDFEFHVSYL